MPDRELFARGICCPGDLLMYGMVEVPTPEVKNGVAVIDAKDMHYSILNASMKKAYEEGARKIILNNVLGQRFIAAGFQYKDLIIEINGVAGNDLGVFMNGPRIIVNGNAQDGVANTMNGGVIVVKGHAGDVLGYGMRGGKLFVEKDVGYRVGIHMKAYKDMVPIIVAGGTAGDFFGEYMAGGILVLLGLNRHERELIGNWVATGMHGGSIFVRGEVPAWKMGKGIGTAEPNGEEKNLLEELVREYASYFNKDAEKILKEPFVKIYPVTHRPYGKLYAP